MRSDFSLNNNNKHNDGFLPGIILLLLTQCYYYLPSGNPFKCHEEVLYYLQPMIPPKRFDIIPPDWEMLRRSSLSAF